MKRKRKHYSGAFKAQVGLEAVMGIKTVAQLAREHRVASASVHNPADGSR